MIDIIISLFITSGLAAVFFGAIIQARNKRKEKAEEAFALINKTHSLFQSAIRATKNYNDGEITENQYFTLSQHFEKEVTSANLEKLGALIAFYFPKIFNRELTKFGNCFSQFAEISKKYCDTVGKNERLSSELNSLAENFELTKDELLIAIVEETRR